MSKKITGQIVRVSRRRFLGGTAAAIATTGAMLLPQQTIASDSPVSLEQMAYALHEAVGRHSDRNDEFFFKTYADDGHGRRSASFGYAMENLRHSSVDEIQCLLKPLFGGAA